MSLSIEMSSLGSCISLSARQSHYGASLLFNLGLLFRRPPPLLKTGFCLSFRIFGDWLGCRYWKVELWRGFFETLLNGNGFPQNSLLSALRRNFENHLRDNSLGKKVKGLLAKQSIMMFSRRWRKMVSGSPEQCMQGMINRSQSNKRQMYSECYVLVVFDIFLVS